MVEPLGNDTTMWVLPDGDFFHGVVLAVDTTDWSLEDFKQFDDCPPSERVGLARMLDAIHKAKSMSVVEITLKG